MMTLVVAVSRNGVIGDGNKLIWHLPEDLKRFKQLTQGNVVVMGRKTHESIGKVLPNRLNVILSRDTKWYKPLGDGCVVCYSIEEVLEKFKFSNLFVIGGEQIYKQFLPFVEKIHLTLIEKDFDGDAYFPILGNEWVVENKTTNSNQDFTYSFIDLIRQ
jgi:dihydrofolate reductase